MKDIRFYEVVGSSKRCLILNIDNHRVFCSTSNYAELCMNTKAHWEVQIRPAHEDHRGIYFPEQYWVVVYKPHFI